MKNVSTPALSEAITALVALLTSDYCKADVDRISTRAPNEASIREDGSINFTVYPLQDAWGNVRWEWFPVAYAPPAGMPRYRPGFDLTEHPAPFGGFFRRSFYSIGD